MGSLSAEISVAEISVADDMAMAPIGYPGAGAPAHDPCPVP
jgi:hypothetical protein